MGVEVLTGSVTKVEMRERDDIPYTFITEKQKSTIKCSNCLAPLVDIAVVDEKEQTFWELRSNCPHCKDKSFYIPFRGRWTWAGVEPEYTAIADSQFGQPIMVDNKMLIRVEFDTVKGPIAWKT